jgi:hypothetical protein
LGKEKEGNKTERVRGKEDGRKKEITTDIKLPEREADHSSQYSDEVKNEWICTSFPHRSW